MYKVYLIRDIHGLKYVGITQSTIKRRLQRHESDKSTGRYYSSSKLDLTCCKISILEDDITEENKKEKEQYWIDKIDCVNKLNAIHNKSKSQNKYYHKNKDKIKEYHKNLRDYQISWGGRISYNDNSLLKIDTTLFLNS